MSHIVKNVGIFGGVHGNELTGVYLLKKWLQNNQTSRESFNTTLIQGNPRAIEEKQRFIEVDLNRSFTNENLHSTNPSSYEGDLAKSIFSKYGPESSSPLDFLIDLHTTTANMASSIVLINNDLFSLRVSAYLKQTLPDVNIFRWTGEDFETAFVNKLADRSLTIELGPIAQNVLRADILKATESMVLKALDFIEDANTTKAIKLPESVEVFQYTGTIDYPKDMEGNITGIIHPELQDQDFKLLAPGSPIFETFDGKTLLYEGKEDIWPIFINEAAYYEKGVAFIKAKKVIEPLST